MFKKKKPIPLMFTTLDFGVENVLQKVYFEDERGGLLGKLLEVATFTVEEARDRLSDLLEGSFVPESAADLFGFLSARFLKLETRIRGLEHSAVNYLVDLKGGGEVPAALVDERLSHQNLLMTKLRESMRRQLGTDMSFGTWQGLFFCLDDAPGGMSMTVEGTVEGYNSWYGRIFDTASDSAVENQRIIERARKEGVYLILPTKPGATDEMDIVPGMPILRYHQSARARDLNPALDHDALTARFGKSMVRAFEEMNETFNINQRKATLRRGAPADVSEQSLTIAAFRQQFMKKPGEVEDLSSSFTDSDDNGFGYSPAPEAEPRMERAARAAPSVVSAPRQGYML